MSRGTFIAALAVTVVSAFGASGALAGELTPALADELALHAASDMVPVYIAMRDVPDYAAIDAQATGMLRKDRQRFVVDQVRAQAERLDDGLAGQLNALQASGEVIDIRNLWSAGAYACKATPAAIRLIAARADVGVISSDAPVPMLCAPVQSGTPVTPASDPTPGTRAIVWSVNYIQAPTVWSSGYNGTGVLVAEMDTGIWYNHPDLAGRMWVNDDPWDGIDNDGNGYVDDKNGYNFYSHVRDPLDDHNHGTHVAGSVAGDGTGGTQTGVAPGAKLMALKILDGGGFGSPSALVESIQYAIANGADVITGSIGWWQPDAATRQSYRNACETARVAGVTMTIAAGNERGWSPPSGGLPRTPGDVPPPWRHPDQPANGSLGGVICCGATAYQSDAIAWFSSYGPSKWGSISPWNDYASTPYLIRPDLCAPGENVNSTMRGGGYSGDSWSGTSMATPHVAGMVALMLSKNPELLPAQVDQIMEENCLPLGATGKDNDFGSGRIRAPQIMAAVPPPGPDLTAPSTISLATAPAPGFGKVRLNWTAVGDDGMTGLPASYDVRWRRATFGPIDDEAKWATATQVSGEPVPAAAGTPMTMLVGQLQLGKNYYFAIRAYDEVPNPSALSNSPMGTASGSATPAGSVGGIDGIVPGGAGEVSAKGYVTLRDADGQPVAGSTVDVQWSGLVSGRVSATTDAQGTARFTSPAASSGAKGVFQFTVLSASGAADLGHGVSGQMAYGTQVPALGGFRLAPANPNPVGVNGTAIQFNLAATGPASLRVYDVTGSLVRVLANGELTAGAHQVRWDGRDDQGRQAANGIYYVRLQSGDQTLSRKMTVLR